MLRNIPEEQSSYLCYGKKPVITHGLGSPGQGKSTAVGFCEHRNELPGFTKGSDFFD
jgi:hypothetical protein